MAVTTIANPMSALREYALTIGSIAEIVADHVSVASLAKRTVRLMPRPALVLQMTDFSSSGDDATRKGYVTFVARCYGRSAEECETLMFTVVYHFGQTYRKFMSRALIHNIAHIGGAPAQVEDGTGYLVAFATFQALVSYDAWQ